MKFTLILWGMLLIGLIDQTYAQTFICNSVKGFDVKSLTNVVQWKTTTDYQCLENPAANCTYFFSFCQTAWACNDQYSACQNITETSNMTMLGKYTTKQFFDDDPSINGFYALFPPGPVQNISNTTQCAPTLRINFNCNQDARWLDHLDYNITGQAPEPTDVMIDPNTNCSTIIYFDYAGACRSGSKPKHQRIDVGALFLIILFSSALVYFIGGAMYNGLVQHRSGINLLPHAQFWIGLPLHAIEGCRTTLNCCSGKTQPSPATYESV